MLTRQELIEDLQTALNDIDSEVNCREGQSFDGELCDAIRYLDDAKEILEQLNKDSYLDESDDDEEYSDE